MKVVLITHAPVSLRYHGSRGRHGQPGGALAETETTAVGVPTGTLRRCLCSCFDGAAQRAWALLLLALVREVRASQLKSDSGGDHRRRSRCCPRVQSLDTSEPLRQRSRLVEGRGFEKGGVGEDVVRVRP